MRPFTRRRLPDAGTGYAGPPAAAMRGRAAEIADAGALGAALPVADLDDADTPYDMG
jgi:hypothetical protein